MDNIEGQVHEAYDDKRNRVLIVDVVSRKVKVVCYGKDVEGPARAVNVGDHVSIKCWPLEARKWEPSDGRPAVWFQDLKASKVTVTRATEPPPKGNPPPDIDDTDVPF